MSVISIVLFLSTILQSIPLTSSQLSISPGDQQKVEKAVKTTNEGLKGISKLFEKRIKTINSLAKPLNKNPAKALETLLKTTKLLGNFAKFLGPAATIFSFIFTFFADSGNDRLAKLITKEFKKVDTKLDAIYDRFDVLEENIENHISANSDTAKLVDYTNAILNSRIKYKYLMNELDHLAVYYNPKSYGKSKLKLLEEFRDFYEVNLVEANIANMVRLIDIDNPLPTLRKDIFSSVREVVDCNIVELTKLYTFIENNLLVATQQKMTYKIIQKGTNGRIDNEFNEWFSKLQKSFQFSILHCQNNVIDYAKKIAEKGVEPKEISTKLKETYPWLSWAVGKFVKEKDKEDVESISRKCFRGRVDVDALFRSEFDGDNYREIQNKDEKMFLLWQDSNIDYTVIEYKFSNVDYSSEDLAIGYSSDYKFCHQEVSNMPSNSAKAGWCMDVIQSQVTNMSNLCTENRVCALCQFAGEIFALEDSNTDEQYILYHLKIGLTREDGTSARFLGHSFVPPEMLHGNYGFFCSKDVNCVCRDDVNCVNCARQTWQERLRENFPQIDKIKALRHINNKNKQIPWRNWHCDMDNKDDWKWITALNPKIDDPCIISRKSHPEATGNCHNIRYTSTHLWICSDGYEGDNCEKKIEVDTENDGLEFLKSKLVEFGNWAGLPTLIDVWWEVNGLEGKIRQYVSEVLDDATEELKFEISHRKTLVNAHYIVDLHDRYNFEEGRGNVSISEAFFMKEIHSLFTIEASVDRFLFNLKEVISDDYLKYEKRKIAKIHPVCSHAYQEKIKEFKKDMEIMVAVIKRTLLKYNNYKEYMEERKEIWRETQNIVLEDFQLQKFWKEQSCPAIYPNAMRSKGFCEDTDTFENAEVTYDCNNPKQSSNINRAQCMNSNGHLNWYIEMSENCPGCRPPTKLFPNPGSTKLECHYLWSPWSSWSSCSQSCDNCNQQYCLGTQSRTRLCAGDESVSPSVCARDSESDSDKSEESRTCNNKDCCQARSMFKCNSNGKCIHKSLICDGKNDCSAGEDEYTDSCPEVIRSGQLVGFDNQCKSNCDYGPRCYLSCVKSDDYCLMKGGWNFNEHFNIVSKYRKHTAGLVNGDSVGLYFNGGWWFSCDCEGWCWNLKCPGSQFSPDLSSGCRKHVFTIHNSAGGQGPIKKGQTVYLKMKYCNNNQYLSGKDGQWVQTTETLANCEKWKIVGG